MLLRQQPLLSAISILGTAFAITMIMAIVITWQIKYSPLSPENNRDRCLYVMHMTIRSKDGNSTNMGYASPAFITDCVEGIPEVEAATAVSGTVNNMSLLTTTDGSKRIQGDVKETDPNFWRVFDFRFISGRGFLREDWREDLNPVVVSNSIAKSLFGRTDVAGQTFMLNREEVKITGVVSDVSAAGRNSYAQIWRMYIPQELNPDGKGNYLKNHCIVIMARSAKDLPKVKGAITNRVKTLNTTLANDDMILNEQPDGIVAHLNHKWGDRATDLKKIYWQYALMLFIILLVPSLNLCGLSNSRMQQRISEMGVRKAFGATTRILIVQILKENMVLTIIGGILGLGLSYAGVYALRAWLFSDMLSVGSAGDFSLSLSTLFSPVVFVLAFLFCLLINLLSAWLPAWLSTRGNIVDSIKDQ